MLSGILIILLHLFAFSSSSNSIIINSSSQFEEYLCNKTPYSNQSVVLVLNSSVVFEVSSGNFCQIQHYPSGGYVQITSDSNDKSANITCKYDDTAHLLANQKRRGFIFYNSNVNLQRLIFNNCGTFINLISNRTIFDYMNSSHLYYTNYHAATLAFIHCQINISNIQMYNSFGFGIVGVNIYNSTIDNIVISDTLLVHVYESENTKTIGCGLMIHFINDSYHHMNATNIGISNSLFTNNNAVTSTKQCLPHIYNRESWNPVVFGAGITILFVMSNYSVELLIDRINFTNNVGGFGASGGLFVYQYSISIPSHIFLTNSFFKNNSNGIYSHCRGAAIAYYWLGNNKTSSQPSEPLSVHNTTIKDHRGIVDSFITATGPVFIGVMDEYSYKSLKFSFFNFSCLSNSANKSGSCLFVYIFGKSGNTSLTINLKDVTAFNNSQSSLQDPSYSIGAAFIFYRAKVIISGTSYFHNNSGSVIDASNSHVSLHDNIDFANNIGPIGGALRLHSSSSLHLATNQTISFTNNKALIYGGAVYVDSGYFIPHKECSIQISKDMKDNSIIFENNTAADSGNSIFATILCDCYMYMQKVLYYDSHYYDKYFNFIGKANNNLQNMSSQPTALQQCNDSYNDLYVIYPGQTISISLKALDNCNHHVYSSVFIYISLDKNKGDSVYINNREGTILELFCTTINTTIRYHAINQTDATRAFLIYSLPQYPQALKVNLNIRKCPLGFDLNMDTGTCECSGVFKFLNVKTPIQCDINHLSISKNTKISNFWMGKVTIDAQTDSFSVTQTCPLKYCKVHFFHYIMTDDETVHVMNDSETLTPLCYPNRAGTICGLCIGNTSTVFGSNDCKQCSNWWLLTLIPYILIGPLLVYILFAFKLTLSTGTLNGVIFFVQVFYCGPFDILMMSHKDEYMPVSAQIGKILLSLLSLNLGFPICFYDRMTTAWKVGLSFTFPLYLLLIIIILIIISRYSVKLSNKISHSSVQVLVTVLHLSFSKLLLSIIDVFTPIYVYTSDQNYTVWFFDGKLFWEHSHLNLMILTLIIVVPLITSYVFILIFHRLLLVTKLNKLNEYIRPIMEAIHAPYKEGSQFWFSARMILLIFMYIAYTCFRGTDYFKIVILIVPILITFTVLQSYVCPFKREAINIIDCWFNWYACLVTFIIWYFFSSVSDQTPQEVITIMTFIFLLSFCCVLFYHFLVIYKKDEVLISFLLKIKRKFSSNKSVTRNRPYLLNNSSDSYYGSCEYREPLLDSD